MRLKLCVALCFPLCALHPWYKQATIIVNCHTCIGFLYKAACRNYFTNKDVEEGVQVAKVMGGFCNPSIVNWIHIHRIQLSTLSFEAFMVEVWDHYLERNWALRMVVQLHNSCQGPNQPFDLWEAYVTANNALLLDTPGYMDEQALLQFCFANMTETPQSAAMDEDMEIHPTTALHMWLEDIVVLNQRIRREEQLEERIQARVTAALAAAQSARTLCCKNRATDTLRATVTNAVSELLNCARTSNSSAPRHFVPKLTDADI